MDFPQQIEDTLVERSASSYDVIMESPIYTSEHKARQRYTNSNVIGTASFTADKMSSSMNSTLEDTTPSDSGIQTLDSESSELMIDSITSQNGFEFDDSKAGIQQEREDYNKYPHIIKAPTSIDENNKGTANIIELNACQNVDTNLNITTSAMPAAVIADDVMTASNCSTFDTENIVYRRKVRKSPMVTKTPKKRVSFHEDILKNTRTDNIHIEHGFITYKNGRKMKQQVGIPGRYSWCSEGDGTNATTATAAAAAELCNHQLVDDNHSDHAQSRRVVYRNACSDVLDYGNSDAYDTNEYCLRYDNSGIFEYLPQEHTKDCNESGMNNREGGDGQVLYKCSCSSSNSSLNSDENEKNSNCQQYGQAKSSSCDCIGSSNTNNNTIGKNCYFSEPNIDNLSESHKKSVWNKEKKPKSSCLKKTNRHSTVIQEQDLNIKVKKFNVHDVNQLIDNSSKMLFGSLKSIFTMPLPERGVPEGSEDLQSVVECIPELDQTPEHKIKSNHPIGHATSPTLKSKPFLSKSLDGSKQPSSVKKFVHNVDEQLRRKNDEQIYAPTRQNSDQQEKEMMPQTEHAIKSPLDEKQNNTYDDELKSTPAFVGETQFRNKFIINCESTVFEHTGVSYRYDSNINELNVENDAKGDIANLIETPIAQPEAEQFRGAFIPMPIKQTFTNFFRSLKESTTSPTSAPPKNVAASYSSSLNDKNKEQSQTGGELKSTAATDKFFALKMHKLADSTNEPAKTSDKENVPNSTACSTISELTSTTSSSIPPKAQQIKSYGGSYNALHLEKQSRHLASPLKGRQQCGGSSTILYTSTGPARYEHCSSGTSNRMSPDIFNGYIGSRGGSGRDSKSTILSEEFEDILTITTDTDKNESDIVIVNFPELNEPNNVTEYANLLKPPQTKTSLINRFLRNVTQKKILETSIRKNNFFANKLKNEQTPFSATIYLPGAKPQNFELIDDLNAEIAMEIEMSGANSPRRELATIDSDLPGDASRFELGVGEISIDIFNGNYLHILRDATEKLMKVFKLYTGYSKEGFMTPVLVFLTDKTLYVTDLVRNRLCSKFVLAYSDLDVILMGPYGNTVLLSNSSRNMQQVLLAGGPYPADGLVANLELCARRSGSTLPAIGQLTLQHLAPLRTFVFENSCVTKDETWMYYAVVNVPSAAIGNEQEPLGPHVKGFLMHRRIKENSSHSKQVWSPGYFLLKAGVLYMFNDSAQRLPSWAMALAECQGARRAVKAGRPHCFEILLKGQLLQLAAPDEYVASEWLQALLQSASGLFEMQEKHKTLGCTLVVTQNHLITLREDFSAPLRKLNIIQANVATNKPDTEDLKELHDIKLNEDNHSMISSTLSTPTKGTQRSCSSVNSTPTKLSQLSRSTATGNTTATSASTASTNYSKQTQAQLNECCSNMSSVYGKNSGLEILSSADIKEMTGIKIPSHNDTWWCILEFSCQEVRESPDDLVIFFASSSEMQRFLRLLEQLWHAKNNDLFPISVLDEDDIIAEHCTMLYMDINRSWEPLLSAALGYPL